MNCFHKTCIALALIAVLSEQPALAEAVDYLTQVKPILHSRCVACHGALKQESSLRLDTAAFVKQGGDSGATIVLNEPPEKSLLIERVSEADPSLRMPPGHEGEPLTAEQIQILQKWITAGAPAPADEVAEKDPRQHWAFQTVKRPAVPEVPDAQWAENPIDAFIASGHQLHQLVPQSEASRLQLLRRLHFDLIGLPPTAEEVSACLADTSPDWYEKTVDKLLADPRHGERWARHWMDVWRYSDWWGLGKQLRNSQQHIWHWRDWIVESLNEDLPYDQMVRLMLAADEIAPDDPDQLRATGFLARNYYIFNRMRWMDETVEHVSKGLLGLTMNCAKCHDHKFDPIDQVDYYRMRAFFEPYLVRLDMVPGEVDVNQDAIPRAFDGLLDQPTYLYIRGDEARPDESKAIQPGVPELLEFASLEINEVKLPPVSSQPARFPWVLENHLAAAQSRLAEAEKKSKAAQTALEKLKAAEEQNQPEKKPDSSFTPILEDFAQLDPARWKTVSGDWSHQPGFVKQSLDGPQRSILQLTNEVPQDFDAKLTFRLHGGSQYRSIGIAFDAEADSAKDPRFLIYASGHAPGPKVQAAYDKNGTWQYPGDGRTAFALELEKDYTLHLQVRGTLMNVSLNGEPVLAWRSPVERRPGLLQLITFDALATFYEFQISELSPEIPLRESNSAPATPADTVANAEMDLKLANSDLDVAQAEYASIQARAAAMRASWDASENSLVQQAAKAAILSERLLAVAQAQKSLAAAEIAMDGAAKDKKAEAESKLTKAKEDFAAAETKLQQEIQESDHFTPLPGAKWTATRFQHTGRDDPAVAFPNRSTGRRTALANWITDQRNPLTARVAVNHIWGRHFGQPLVSTTFDLGRNSKEPHHPELLDWLAAELIESGWSMKHIHRLIVTSKTYRLGSSSAGMDQQLTIDPDNHYLWRRVPIRLESQAVRDSVLALAGSLDETMGGPPVPPQNQAKSHRRSLYFFHSNNERNLLLTTFDEASVAECYQREQSIVPQQALALTNSALVLESSSQIAERISAAHQADETFIKNAFQVLLGIEPQPEEIADCLAALNEWKQVPNGAEDSARRNLIWSLINHNDFVTLR